VNTTAATVLERLEHLKGTFGPDAARDKLDALRALERGPLRTAGQVRRLHEILCWIHAYPDDEAVLAQVRLMLEHFARRADLRRHRAALADTGIAGTAIQYVFFWFTAQWLARCWPDRIAIDWPAFDSRRDLLPLLHLMLPYSETTALDEVSLSARQWIARLKGPGETDAAFLVRRFEALHPSPFGRETLYENLGVPLVLAPGTGTPARTTARYPVCAPVFQTRPIDRSRPSLGREIRRAPLAVRPVSPDDADRLIDLAREAMVTRARDLDNFIHADRHDVRVFEFGNGLQFACFGMIPERRLVLESVYGMLTLRNGVPIGYVLASGLFGSSEVMYNVFDTYRGGEASRIYGSVLSIVAHLFGADTFAIDPFQLGHDNHEGQQSGAFWFYYKLGFRPRDRHVRELVRRELERLSRRPGERSGAAMLQKLSAAYVFLHTAKPRRDVLGLVSLGNVGLHVSRYLAAHAGAERERGMRASVREAARLLGVRSMDTWTPAERLAWERWSPLVLCLPGMERWSPADRRAMVAVVRAKGGRRESDFVNLFDGHRRLRSAILELARR
jgi:hypothetical protein